MNWNPIRTDLPQPVIRYQCCKHCIAEIEGCPRYNGHAARCGVVTCPVVYVDGAVATGPAQTEILERRNDTVTDIMVYNAEERLLEQKDELIEHVRQLIGHEPPGLRVLLRALSHPEVAGEAMRYFAAMDTETRCTKYEPPWNCAREAEALYQNVRYGWLGAAGGIGFDESWCEPCRKKVLGT